MELEEQLEVPLSPTDVFECSTASAHASSPWPAQAACADGGLKAASSCTRTLAAALVQCEQLASQLGDKRFTHQLRTAINKANEIDTALGEPQPTPHGGIRTPAERQAGWDKRQLSDEQGRVYLGAVCST